MDTIWDIEDATQVMTVGSRWIDVDTPVAQTIAERMVAAGELS